MLIGGDGMDDQKQRITAAVAVRIKQFRYARSMSQEELAFRANLNPAYYGQVERGLKCPTIDTLYKIAKALDIPPSELLRSDALPGYRADRGQRLKELLARVPEDKLDQVYKILEDLIGLF